MPKMRAYFFKGRCINENHLLLVQNIQGVSRLNDIDQKLFNFYESKWSKISDILRVNERLSYPLFMSLPQAYYEARKKLMIVGQQGYQWGFSKKDSGRDPKWNSTQQLIQLYKNFALGKQYIKSPFWQAAHELYNLLNPNASPDGFLWSNLITVDDWNKRPDQAVEQSVCELGLLSEEIQITKPDVVVFFTGPYYDEMLKKTFDRLELQKISTELAIVKHPLLPVQSFRTYHPGFLWRSKKRRIIKEIADLSFKPNDIQQEEVKI